MPDTPSPLLLDIPSVTLTATTTIGDLISSAQDVWQRSVTEITYPVLWIGGLTAERDVLFRDNTGRPGQSLNEVVEACRRNKTRLWLDLDLDLKPVRADLVHVRDFYGGSSSHACINSPATHTALK